MCIGGSLTPLPPLLRLACTHTHTCKLPRPQQVTGWSWSHASNTHHGPATPSPSRPPQPCAHVCRVLASSVPIRCLAVMSMAQVRGQRLRLLLLLWPCVPCLGLASCSGPGPGPSASQLLRCCRAWLAACGHHTRAGGWRPTHPTAHAPSPPPPPPHTHTHAHHTAMTATPPAATHAPAPPPPSARRACAPA